MNEPDNCTVLVAQNSLYDVGHPQLSQIGIRLTAAHENNRLSCDVGHGKRSTDLVVDGVPLGNQHAVNATALARRGAREITQCTVEFGQLIDGFVTYQGFSDEEDLVWVVDGDELGQCPHQWLIVLHTTSRVDEHYIETVVFRVCDRFLGDSCSVLAIPFFVELHAPFAIGSAIDSKHAQVAHVNPELLHSTTPERVTSSDQDAQAVLNEPEANFGQVGTLADAIDAYENDAIRNALLRGSER